MDQASDNPRQSLHLKRNAFTFFVIWSAMIALLCAWHVRDHYQSARDMAHIEARQALDKDMAYRIWAAKHGGVYVPVTEETPPNPYLTFIENRDVTTTDGQHLTLINPAYMTRQVHELSRKLYGLEGHLTSLDPIRPENAPDAWETRALRTFTHESVEVSEVIREGGIEFYRLMRPLYAEAPCLKCHQHQGYKLGELRGGLSVKVPMEPLEAIAHSQSVGAFLSYSLVWLTGLLGGGIAFRNIMKRSRLREQSEEALRQNERKLRLTLNSIGDGVITTDLQGQVTQMNLVAAKLTGWNSTAARGKPLGDIFSIHEDQSLPDTPEHLEDLLASEGMYGMTGSGRLLAKGVEYQVTYSAAPILDTDGNSSGMVLVFQNVTGQKQLQDELLKARKLESVAILAGGLAHDFNNMFTGLFGNIQLAKMKLAKDHPAYPYLDAAHRSFEMGTNLTRQLLTFAKGGQPLLEETDLKQVIQDALRESVKGDTIKVNQYLPDDLWHVRGDRGQLSQVFNNLFTNAVQAMTSGGALYIDAENIEDLKIEVAPGLSGEFVKVRVRDEGAGIPAEEIPKVFDIFYTTKAEGRGMGLATVHRIIAKHNGYIDLDSIPGVGTTFTLYLPAETAVEEPAPVIAEQGPETANTAAGRILVMDDEEMIRNLASDMLEMSGYRVETANDGDEAIAKYVAADKSGRPFDVVIMDLFIPGGMGGKDAVKKLIALYPQAKVIVTSGYFADAVMAEFNAYGFKGRLAKPFQLEALQQELSRVINM